MTDRVRVWCVQCAVSLDATAAAHDSDGRPWHPDCMIAQVGADMAESMAIGYYIAWRRSRS
jgi:hypothetical protein